MLHVLKSVNSFLTDTTDCREWKASIGSFICKEEHPHTHTHTKDYTVTFFYSVKLSVINSSFHWQMNLLHGCNYFRFICECSKQKFYSFEKECFRSFKAPSKNISLCFVLTRHKRGEPLFTTARLCKMNIAVTLISSQISIFSIPYH
jgi:hypothetical protein